jgi:hypothetical protein
MTDQDALPASGIVLEKERCPVCSGSTTFRFTIRDIPIRRCDSCGHGFAVYRPGEEHVGTIYGDDYFFGGGAGYRDYTSEGKLLQQQGRRYGESIGR